MKKHKLLFLTLALVFVLAGGAVAAELPKLLYTDYSVSYASLITPSLLENNDTGVYDTGDFSAKVGVDILKWADVYAGASYMIYIMRPDMQKHYSFIPLYLGVRANIFPEWCVFPGLFVEAGTVVANEHTRVAFPPNPSLQDRDNTWMGSYLNFGFDVNLNVADMAVLALRFERPSISNQDKAIDELHIFKAGLAWKVAY